MGFLSVLDLEQLRFHFSLYFTFFNFFFFFLSLDKEKCRPFFLLTFTCVFLYKFFFEFSIFAAKDLTLSWLNCNRNVNARRVWPVGLLANDLLGVYVCKIYFKACPNLLKKNKLK